MSTPPPPPPNRRFALAVGSAVASTTIAVGVTAGALLGWFRPATSQPVEPAPTPAPAQPVIFVPVTPDPPPAAAPAEPAVQLAMDREGHEDRDHDDDDDHEDHEDHEEHEDD
ncbi:MAG TPA: hypothetical protein VFQ53_04925 [Kofleriaceae bacterium]|nr:hypothetical protein [Kofleriaceae bacterium]